MYSKHDLPVGKSLEDRIRIPYRLQGAIYESVSIVLLLRTYVHCATCPPVRVRVSRQVSSANRRPTSGEHRTWCSPYIHPPFKNTPSRCVRRLEWDAAEVQCSDKSRGSWVCPIEIRDEFVRLYIVGRLPGVVFRPKALPLDQVLESTSVDPGQGTDVYGLKSIQPAVYNTYHLLNMKSHDQLKTFREQY